MEDMKLCLPENASGNMTFSGKQTFISPYNKGHKRIMYICVKEHRCYLFLWFLYYILELFLKVRYFIFFIVLRQKYDKTKRKRGKLIVTYRWLLCFLRYILTRLTGLYTINKLKTFISFSILLKDVSSWWNEISVGFFLSHRRYSCVPKYDTSLYLLTCEYIS
jgi:hypothetical protein